MVLTATLMVLAGCEDTLEGDGELTETSMLSTATVSATSDGDGIVVFAIEVPEGATSMLLTAWSDTYTAFEGLQDPSGDLVLWWEDWYYADQSLTYAFWSEAPDAELNWPVREEDGPLEAGTWLAQIGTYDADLYYTPNTELALTLQLKDAADFTGGVGRARIVYADGVNSDDEAVYGTEQAVERWKEVWGAYGLDLQVDYATSDLHPDLPFPDGSTDDITSESAEFWDSDLTVLIGEEIEGSQDYYGVSGGIPGTLIAAPRSAVVVSWLANAGGDGVFSDEDIRLYGETLAHEVGHYSGLFHPVEDGWEYWDALSDTPDCDRLAECESELGDNLMFPYPVCDYTSCPPQDQLSDGQVGVGHRYTGTL